MSNEVRTNLKGDNDASRANSGNKPIEPDANFVHGIGIILITVYLIIFTGFLVYSLIQLWPSGSSIDGKSSSVNFLTWTFATSDEVHLLIVVAMAGALGGLVHTLRSFYWYVGNRVLAINWLAMYILLPFVGATLGLIFYFVIRGGFFSPQTTVEQTSPFGFAALAGLVGLFSEQAVLKLKEVAEILLAKPKPGADSKPQT
jgi:hypothetical protein